MIILCFMQPRAQQVFVYFSTLAVMICLTYMIKNLSKNLLYLFTHGYTALDRL